MKEQLFVYPRLGVLDNGFFRIGGPGLGNLLFPWARAVILAKRLGLPLLSATWPQFKTGPLFRGEKDTRTYMRLFRPLGDEISGFQKTWLLGRMPRFPENILGKRKGMIPDRGLVEVEGMGNFFQPLLPSQSLLKSRLLEMLRPGVFSTAPDPNPFIAVHIRLGDFSIPSSLKEIQSGKGSRRLPLDWYRRVIENVRKGAGKNFPARIFSDGSREQLGDLLSLPDTTLQKQGTSIGDILIMSESSILVASASTFSMWASFLGQASTVWFKSQKKHRLVTEKGREIEAGLDGKVPAGFSKKAFRARGRGAS
jgi:hypothetical protein